MNYYSLVSASATYCDVGDPLSNAVGDASPSANPKYGKIVLVGDYAPLPCPLIFFGYIAGRSYALGQ